MDRAEVALFAEIPGNLMHLRGPLLRLGACVVLGICAATRFSVPVHPGSDPAKEPITLSIARIPQAEPVVVDCQDRLSVLSTAYQVGVGDWMLCTDLVDGEVVETTLLTREPRQIVQPCAVVTADGGLRSFWVELSEGRPRLVSSVRRSGQWSAPAPLEVGFERARAPACALAADGSVWLAFEAECPDAAQRSQVDVFLARIGDDSVPEVFRITERSRADFSPSVCADDQGRLWLAWTRSTGIDYEVVARAFDTRDGSLSPEIEVSRDVFADDHHPDIAWRAKDGVWVVYDAWTSPQRGVSDPVRRGEDEETARTVVKLAHLEKNAAMFAEGLEGEAPGVVESADRLCDNGGTPRLILEESGAISVVCRNYPAPFQDGDAAYPVTIRTWSGKSWSEPRSLADSEGPSTRVSVASGTHGTWMAWEQARRPPSQPARSLKLPLDTPTDDELARQGLRLSWLVSPRCVGIATAESHGEVSPPPTRSVEAARGPRSHPLHSPLQSSVISGPEHPVIHCGDREYLVVWGDLHRHSNLSQCSKGLEPGPDLRYTVARDLLFDDFFALTDHSGHLDIGEWWSSAKLVDLYHSDRFQTFQGYEWSTVDYGHQNVIQRRRTDEVLSSKYPDLRSPTDLWSTLEEGDSITIPHHTAHERMAYRWEFDDPRFLRLVEVVQCRGSFEFDGCYRRAIRGRQAGSFVQDGLSLDRPFGLIGSTDHGNGACYAAALVESIDRDSIFEAFLARRTFASTTRGMVMDLQVCGVPQGGLAECTRAPPIDLRVIGTTDLSEVALFRNGELLFAEGRPASFEAARTFRLEIETEMRADAVRDLGQELELRIRSDEAVFTPGRESGRERGTVGFRRAGRGAVRWMTGSEGNAGWRDSANEVQVEASSTAILEFLWDDQLVTTSVADLARAALQGRFACPKARPMLARRGLPFTVKLVGGTELFVDPAVSMGRADFERSFADDSSPVGNSWYYARAIQTDGEVAWSSPVFVSRSPAAGSDSGEGSASEKADLDLSAASGGGAGS